MSASMEAEAFNSSHLSPNLLFGEGHILFSKGNFGNKLWVLQDQKVFSREEQPQSGWSSPYSTLRTKAHEKSWYSARYLRCSPRHQVCVQTLLWKFQFEFKLALNSICAVFQVVMPSLVIKKVLYMMIKSTEGFEFQMIKGQWPFTLSSI